MSKEKQPIGSIGWIDLTVPDAEQIRAFYSKVVGWDSTSVSMGDYDDFIMMPKDGDRPAAGICHARGVNKNLPATWLIYIVVEDLKKSVKQCIEAGRSVLVNPVKMGDSASYCIIKDPAGAVAALYSEN